MASKQTVPADFTELSPTAWKVIVSVPDEKFRKALNKLYGEIAQNIKIDGFRPGKAPHNVINRHYGKEKIINETYQDVIEDTLWPVLKEKELSVIGPPRIDPGKWEEGRDFTYTAVIEVVPQIPPIDISAINPILPDRSFSDKELDEELRRMSLRLGEFEAITDRPVQKGDIILATFEGEVDSVMVDSIDGPEPWKIKDESMEVEIGAGRAIAGLEDLFTGMELEEIKDIEITLPDDFGDRRVRGKTLKGKIRVKSVRKVTPAELTDDFIKEKLGDQKIETLDNLKEQVKAEVENTHSQLDERSIIDQIESFFSRSFDFPLPEGLVRGRYADILDRTLDTIKRDGGDIKKLMEDGNPTGLKVRKRSRYQAERVVKLDLLMREIARKETIGVAQEEVINYIAFLAMRQGIGEKDLRALIQDPQFIESTKDELLRKKVIHFLVGKVAPARVSEEEFKKMLDDARADGEAHEKQYLDSIDDPKLLKGDYLGCGESTDSVQSVSADGDTEQSSTVADKPSESGEEQ